MKREFLGEVLQTIYLDVFVYDDSYMYVHQTGSEEMTKIKFPEKSDNIYNIFQELVKQIHPRYTKVIIDANTLVKTVLRNFIDDKFNNKTIDILTKEDVMLEMVQVILYNPKRIDVKKFMAEKTIY